MHKVILQAVALSGVAIAAGTTSSTACNYTALASRLSSTSSIILPGSSDFNDTVARWSNLEPPTANLVVVPGTEDDVVQTVQFANECSLPFLASNGVHGSITTLGTMTHGIAISLSQLTGVEVAPDGQTAVIGGGVRARNLTDALWAAGKQTVTGTCECVGYLGPALGGGHGWLQGRHGLVADQMVAANLVLANGSLVTVTRDAQQDLFWALRGAGHNFGIVTSVTAAIYDIEHPDYAISTLLFSGDQVEDVYQLANDLWYPNQNGSSSMPVDLNNWSYWYFDPTTDSEKPIIAMYIIQEGVTTVDPAHTAPFLALGPLASQAMAGTYLDLARWTGISLGDGPCQKTGDANPRFPLYLAAYNITAQRRAYDLFAQATTTTTDEAASTPFANALFMFEGYAQQGVRAISDSTTAFAYRDKNLLVAPLLTYTPTSTSSSSDTMTSSNNNGTQSLDQRAWELGNQLRQILWEGSGESTLATYVNYAYGDETPLAWYGSESWRQERLRALKTEFDPEGKFSFYAPIL